jgi:phytoene dehydrogenase-like protein
VVIGAGANGLTAAWFLARQGRRVLVCERRESPDALPHTGWIPPGIVHRLDLLRHGLVVERPDPWISAPLDSQARLELFADVDRSATAIARVSPRDAQAWPAFSRRMHQLAAFLKRLYDAPPPVITNGGTRRAVRLAELGVRFRGLGKTGMVDLLRVPPMPVSELLDDWFENTTLKGLLGAGAVTGIRQGPMSPATAYVLLHHHVGAPLGVFRQPLLRSVDGSGPEIAFERAARAAGVEIRRGSAVARVTVRDGAARGVVLESGEELGASLVLSSADPRQTFLKLVEPDLLDPEFTQAARNVKFRGAAARVEVTLSTPAPFGTLTISPSLEYLERAYDATKYGRVSDEPWIEGRAFSQQGTPRVSFHVQYAPYQLRDATWDEARKDELGNRAIRIAEARLPGFSQTVVRREVFTPFDLEQRYGASEGNLYHGEMTLDQVLFMRPIPGWSAYRTPVPGLYLCGAGAHPGGGIVGAPGKLGAEAAMRQLM